MGTWCTEGVKRTKLEYQRIESTKRRRITIAHQAERIEQLQAELKDKTKMLEKYGKHVLGCKLHTPGVCFCTCGFDQALNTTYGKDD